MSWISFNTRSGGLLKVRTRHIVAIYDEANLVKLSTVAGEVHILADGISVQQAATMAEDAGAPLDRYRQP
jgi:hypothetical protein